MHLLPRPVFGSFHTGAFILSACLLDIRLVHTILIVLCILPACRSVCLSACSKPMRLHYLGVSFGLTQQLFNFWQRAGYEPAYVRQNASETTGEWLGSILVWSLGAKYTNKHLTLLACIIIVQLAAQYGMTSYGTRLQQYIRSQGLCHHQTSGCTCGCAKNNKYWVF